MSIVRTIMKIVLIIIGLIALITTAEAAPEPQYYISDYYLPYGREVYGKGSEEWLPSSRQEKKEDEVYRIVPYPYQKIGLHGFGFETRLAFADGLQNPITPETLAPYNLGYPGYSGYSGYSSQNSYGDQYAPIAGP